MATESFTCLGRNLGLAIYITVVKLLRLTGVASVGYVRLYHLMNVVFCMFICVVILHMNSRSYKTGHMLHIILQICHQPRALCITHTSY